LGGARRLAAISARFERHPGWKMAAIGSSCSGLLPWDREESVMGVAKKAKRRAKSVKGKAKKGAGKVKHKGKKAKNAARH
jgi:hypothetical protein